jgi:recombination protein RecT
MNQTTALTPIHQVREELAPLKTDFASMLPSHIAPDRFMQVIITALERDPSLLDADRTSLLIAAKEAASDGLLPDRRDGAFVIFNTKVKVPGGPAEPGKPKPLDKEIWVKQVRWMIMVYGVRKKIFQTGLVKDMQVELVHENDFYERAAGDDAQIVHKPLDFGDRGKVKGGYAIISLINGGVFREVMSIEQIQAVANVSKSDTVWKGPFADEMRRKTILRRLAKQVPLSTEVERVMAREDSMFDFDRVAMVRPDMLPGGERHRAARSLSAHEMLEDRAIRNEPAAEESTDAPAAQGEANGDATAVVTEIRGAKTLEALLGLEATVGADIAARKFTDEAVGWIVETMNATLAGLGGKVDQNLNYQQMIEAAIAARPPKRARRAGGKATAAAPETKEAEKVTPADAEPLGGGEAAEEPCESGGDDAPAPEESGAGPGPEIVPTEADQQRAAEAEDEDPVAAPLGGILSSDKGPQTWVDPNLWMADLLNKLNTLKGEPAKAFWAKNIGYIEFARDHGHGPQAERLLKVGKERGLRHEA